MSIWNVINLAGGLAMFIFGMNLMSDGLKLVAGSYLKKILEKLTKNRIIAMMVGAGLPKVDVLPPLRSNRLVPLYILKV